MFVGVDAVVFGAEDFETGRRFLQDWGLTDAGSDDNQLKFVTRDGSEVIVRKPDDDSLPEANAQPPALREVVWGLDSETSLKALADRLGADAITDSEGRLAVLDRDGFTHAFRVSKRLPLAATGHQVNGQGLAVRVDQRSPVYREAQPLGLGHVVLWSNDIEVAADFFKEKLGFVESDRFTKFGIFLRASTPGPHHHIFLQNRPGKPGADHVAFTVNNMLEVLGGGLAMDRKGWPTRLGPGFHPVSSAVYWYLESPLGAQLEYYADDDYCTENWEAKEYSLSAELYTDWAVTGFHKQNNKH